jgi:hypothetical protein
MSMVKLSRIDFQTTDPAGLRVAVKLPASIRPQRDKLRLQVTVKFATGAKITQDFVLSESSDAADLAMLREQVDAGTHDLDYRFFAYRLDAAEADRLAAFREDLKNKQAAGDRGGGLTIHVVPEACRTAAIASNPVLFTTYLRTPETGGYVTLAEDVDIRTLVPGRDLVSEMPTCGPGD